MTITKHLLEAASLVSEAASEDGTWRVRLISEGKGSSGLYPATLLENHHKAFNNVLSFRNHPTGWDGPQARDFTMIAGKVVGETWVEEDERGLKAIYANYLPDPEYKDKIARYKDQLGLSIYIEGSGYENENGEFVVDWFNPEDPYASVDVVIAPGARGKFMESLSQIYSQRSENKDPGARQEEQKKEIPVEKIEKVEADIAALTTLVNSLVTEKTNAEAAKAQVEADAEAVASAVEAYDVAVKAIDEAELLPVQVEALRARALKGEDVTEAITEAKAIKEAAVEAVKVEETSSQGRVIGERKVESATDLGKVFG